MTDHLRSRALLVEVAEGCARQLYTLPCKSRSAAEWRCAAKSRDLIVLTLLLAVSVVAAGQDASKPELVLAILTEPGSTLFHLQAIITERADPNESR